MKLNLLIVLFILFFQCKNENQRIQEIIEKKLEERRSAFIKERIITCENNLILEIDNQADSILIYLAKKIKYDSLTIPYDSIRPVQPDIQFPKYKKPEKPIQDSILN